VTDFLVARTVDIATGLSVELRVALATAELWAPAWIMKHRVGEHRIRLLTAIADGEANRIVRGELRRRHVESGHWRATFWPDRVEIEPA
jgi:hypothetical protein